MRQFVAAVLFAFPFLACTSAHAMPACQQSDNTDLCAISEETRADNPTFAQMAADRMEGEQLRMARHATRRARTREILASITEPTWRDLYRAGYVIAYGDTPEEDLLAHAIAIRALSLAPDEPDARFLVAMTIDEIGRRYVGAQLYGRQKYFEFDPPSGAQVQACLPQMINPPLPVSVGAQFHRVEGFAPCPPGVGVFRQ